MPNHEISFFSCAGLMGFQRSIRPRLIGPRLIGPRLNQRLVPGLGMAIGLFLILGLGACGKTKTSSATGLTPTQSDRPAVVATMGVVCDLARQIGRDSIDLTCLIEPGRDPHAYEPTPGDRAKLEQAKLILYGGYSLEGGLGSSIAATKTTAAKLAVYEQAVPKPLRGWADDHDHSHGQGDHADQDSHDSEPKPEVKPEANPEANQSGGDRAPDPHVWHDPKNGIQITTAIAQALSQVNPSQAGIYQERSSQIGRDLAAIDAWIKAQVTTIPPGQRQLVTAHRAFGYYAAAYGFVVKGTLSGLSTAERPSVGDLAKLVDQVRSAKVPAIFSESTTNPKTIATVAQNAGVRLAAKPLLVEGPSAAGSDADSYQKMLVENTCTIVTALAGRCDRSGLPATAVPSNAMPSNAVPSNAVPSNAMPTTVPGSAKSP